MHLKVPQKSAIFERRDLFHYNLIKSWLTLKKDSPSWAFRFDFIERCLFPSWHFPQMIVNLNSDQLSISETARIAAEYERRRNVSSVIDSIFYNVYYFYSVCVFRGTEKALYETETNRSWTIVSVL